MKGKDLAMSTERDLRENERILKPSRRLPLERQLQQVSQGTSFPDDNEGTGQDRNMEYTSSFTNQLGSEDLDSQTIEVEEDPELISIAAQLRETSSYAIKPTFKEELRKDLLQQFVVYHAKERDTSLSDLGKHLSTTEKSSEQVSQEEELQLHNGAPHSYENDFGHNIFFYRIRNYINRWLQRFTEIFTQREYGEPQNPAG